MDANQNKIWEKGSGKFFSLNLKNAKTNAKNKCMNILENNPAYILLKYSFILWIIFSAIFFI